ncbi:NAD(P)-binding protein [Xylaria venustula]|nr:NAD(P)-binding protein [Xylaria venustula]
MQAFRNFKTQTWPPKPTFTEANVPPGSQTGRVFMVTGGNTGIGFELCKILFNSGATIYMASRSKDKATAAIKEIVNSAPKNALGTGQLKFLQLDLADLKSVVAAAETFAAQEAKLDVLWDNAAAAAASSPGQAHQSAPPNGVDFNALDKGLKDRLANYGASKAGTWFLAREYGRHHGADGILSVTLNPGNLHAGSFKGTPAPAYFIMSAFILHEPVFGAYTELYAGLSPDLKMEHNGTYVIPWGRRRLDSEITRQDIVKAITSKAEGGLGCAMKLW